MFNQPAHKLIFIYLVAFSIACGNASQQQQQGPPPAVPVTTDTVKAGSVTYFDEYPATLVALNQVELRPLVSGFVTGVHFTDGSRVRKGQLLYSIDQQLYEANYQQAIANLKVQEANLAKAQKDADRFHELDKKDAVAKQLVDNADAALEVAKKQVEAARAGISGVQTNVRYTKVYAPFDGVIGISMVKTGSPVTAGQTLLNTVSTDNPMAVDINADQKEIFRFSQLMEKTGSATDSTFTLAFGADTYGYPGKILLMDRAVNPQTGAIKMRLSFPNPGNVLKAGMNGTIRIRNNPRESTITIPNKAITEQLGEFFVYVVGDSSKVTQVKVQTGESLGPDIVIKNGLNVGNVIVVQGVQNLREGAVVTTSAPPAPAGKK